MGMGHNYRLCMEIDKILITTVEHVELLGAISYSKLKFDIKSLGIRAKRSVSALPRVAKIIDLPICKFLYNSFAMSNFRY